MATKLTLLPLLLCSIFLFQGICLARNSVSQSPNECQIQELNPVEPTYTLRAEAGQTEFWENNEQSLRCAGVDLKRHTVQPRGLVLPAYTNAPQILYVEQGRGIFGILIPGCPETYQSSQVSQQEQRTQILGDRHQKIGELQQGDIITIPAGSAHWIYNEGNEQLVIVALSDTSNNANQLDNIDREFFIAGNPQTQSLEQQLQGHMLPRKGGKQQKYQEYSSGNIFRGFSIETLMEAFGVDERTARKLQGLDDERGHIISAEQGLQVIRPPVVRESGRPVNGLEETICTAKHRENIDAPERADVYNPNAGRFTTLNSFSLPILSFLQLSVERGVLYRNAIFAPHFFTNCHNVMYVTRGESRVQIVNDKGQAVFDGVVRAGQVIVVPQNFAVVKQAGEQGFEWVGFNTAEDAMINTLSGRTSAIRGMPVDVVANAYQISREEAQSVKLGRDTTLLIESSSNWSRRRVASA